MMSLIKFAFPTPSLARTYNIALFYHRCKHNAFATCRPSLFLALELQFLNWRFNNAVELFPVLDNEGLVLVDGLFISLINVKSNLLSQSTGEILLILGKDALNILE
jgi:hypothetical protein